MPARLRGSSLAGRAAPAPAGAWWVVVPVLSSLFVYRTLVNVYFNSDDFLNLYLIVNRSPIEYIMRPHGGHVLMFRNAVFWLTFQLFGAWPEFYQATVLLTHLLNVALLYLLLWRVTGNGIVSAIASGLWGTCPAHGGTIGWYCVYGQVLVTTIVLAMLNQAVRPTSDGTRIPWHIVVTWPLLLLIASTSFGIGIGITLVAPAVFFLLLPPSPQRLAVSLVLLLLALGTPYLYSQALALHQWYSGVSSEGFAASVAFQQRGLNLQQLMMMLYLFVSGLSTFILGFFATPDEFPPAAWIIAAVCGVLAAVTFVAGDARTRRVLFAFTVLALGCYGIIAQGRSQFFQVDTVAAGAAQARYHYAATVPFAALLAVMASRALARWRLGTALQLSLLVACLALNTWAYGRSGPVLDLFATARKETLIVINSVLKQVGQTWRVREVFIRNYPFRAIGTLYVLNQIAFPGWAAVYTIFFPANEVAGKRVYFVDKEAAVAVAARRGRRTNGLIISEHDIRPCEYP